MEMNAMLLAATSDGAPIPTTMRYNAWMNVGLSQGGCPLNDLLLVGGAFYERYYERYARPRLKTL